MYTPTMFAYIYSFLEEDVLPRWAPQISVLREIVITDGYDWKIIHLITGQ
jgi:hypothetical protein